jgi:prepilin-type N-terminal cleavage/methylation domain-containing protein
MIETISIRERERRRSGGFTLAEVLVATALLAVIILALFGLVSAGVRRAYSGKKMTEASLIAQHVMQRVNTYTPQALWTSAPGGVATCTASECTATWSRAGATTTPAAEGGSSNDEIERNAIRNLLATADLPSSSAHNATLTVSVTGVVPTSTANTAGTAAFASASMERVVVTLTWYEWGSRKKQVRLQALNLRALPTTTS